MKKITWRKHHKWFGIVFSLFMLLFCISGIILNHRTAVANVNISRQWLPESFQFNNWNNGLLRGTTPITTTDNKQAVLLYGAGGIWLTDSTARKFTDFNNGMPQGADYRNIRSCVQLRNGAVFAAGAFGLYQLASNNKWQKIPIEMDDGERISDITSHGDSLIVVGRSHLYVTLAPYNNFESLTLKTPDNYDSKVSLFRTVWLIHSGELFGIIGKLIIDAVAIILIVLCITGILFWLMPKRLTLLLHDRFGRYTIVLTLFVCLTGLTLRPPLLIALAMSRVPAVPYSKLDSKNAWNDRLRMLRYDDMASEWLLSSSEGFYSLKSLTDIPQHLKQTPPVSVMGITVFKNVGNHNWLIGSFSGMYIWNRDYNMIVDYFTAAKSPATAGAPFGNVAVAGYTNDFNSKSTVVEYGAGNNFAPMPDSMRYLPMSLWAVALEVHTGRIFTALGSGTMLYIFFAGLIAIWCLWSGYKIRQKR